MLSGDALAEDIWNVPEGAELLLDVERFLSRFISYPGEHAQIAHTLWIAHTHLMDCWDSTPRVAFLSPEPGSGKSRCLEVSELLVPRPVEAVSVSASYLFRKVSDEAGRPTILFDEVDTIFGAKAKGDEEIRGLLNAGHRKGAVAGRCVVRGKLIETEELPAYCAVALAGLGDLPDTILTRSVIIKMRRRAPHEPIEPFRRRVNAPEGEALRERLAAWAEQVEHQVVGAYPEMPEGVTDRPADVWEALLAVADAAGGEWPARARVSCVTHVSAPMGDRGSLGIKLLEDLRLIFGDAEHMATVAILEALHSLEDSPWGDLRGKPLDARGLAQRLRKYEVQRAQVRIGETTAKGYRATDLFDAWQRYLPPPLSPYETETSVTSETSRRREVLAPGETGVEPVPGWAE